MRRAASKAVPGGRRDFGGLGWMGTAGDANGGDGAGRDENDPAQKT